MSNDSGHGGYRRPEHPAAASGPGSLSRRTDGGPGDHQAESRLPTAAAQPTPSPVPASAGAGPTGPSAAPLTPLNAPSTRPDEAVTHGAALGPGLGLEALGLETQPTPSADMERVRPYLRNLERQADRPETTVAFRMMVQALRKGLR